MEKFLEGSYQALRAGFRTWGRNPALSLDEALPNLVVQSVHQILQDQCLPGVISRISSSENGSCEIRKKRATKRAGCLLCKCFPKFVEHKLCQNTSRTIFKTENTVLEVSAEGMTSPTAKCEKSKTHKQ